MRAAFYEQNGPAREMLKFGEVDTPQPGPGEVLGQARHLPGVNPSDVKARAGSVRKIAYPARHSPQRRRRRNRHGR